jgi:hypothetical protein
MREQAMQVPSDRERDQSYVRTWYRHEFALGRSQAIKCVHYRRDS